MLLLWVQRGGPQKKKKMTTNCIKSTLLCFLKVCLNGCYTKCQFYRISVFPELNIGNLFIYAYLRLICNHFFLNAVSCAELTCNCIFTLKVGKNWTNILAGASSTRASFLIYVLGGKGRH